MSFLFLHIRPGGDLRQVHLIRKQVFVEEQAIPYELDLDGKDEMSEHVLVLLKKDGDAIGTGRLTPVSPSHGILSRISVLPSFRGKGLGRRIILELESYAIQRGLQSVSLSPHSYLESFYQSIGYETLPGRESTAGNHLLIEMKKNIC